MICGVASNDSIDSAILNESRGVLVDETFRQLNVHHTPVTLIAVINDSGRMEPGELDHHSIFCKGG